MMVFTIAWRELRNLFLSPLAWVLLAAMQLVLGWWFLYNVQAFLLSPNGSVTDQVAAGTYGLTGLIMLFVMPLLSMRLLSEEHRSGSLALLLSAPVRMSEVVLGKYLGLMGFLAVMLAMLSLMPLSLAMGTHLDYLKLASCILGMLLLMGAFAAAGLYMSSLTRQPAVAAVSSFGLILFLWIVDVFGGGSVLGGPVFQYLSLRDHFSTWLQGSFSSADLVYFLLFIGTFLVLSVRRLDSARLRS